MSAHYFEVCSIDSVNPSSVNSKFGASHLVLELKIPLPVAFLRQHSASCRLHV